VDAVVPAGGLPYRVGWSYNLDGCSNGGVPWPLFVVAAEPRQQPGGFVLGVARLFQSSRSNPSLTNLSLTNLSLIKASPIPFPFRPPLRPAAEDPSPRSC
jgi:hypothetical protein